MKSDSEKRALKNAFLISLGYVGLGTVSVLCVYPPYYGDWVLIGLLVTFPVSILSFGIMHAEADAYNIVLFVQFIIFLFCWLLAFRYLRKKYNNENVED
ncbi:hypothetical protein GVN16_10420 [Emticicia sp. CRIBPO]|uniref:hypothetical protein n=1 Tax=Emticicia sp. CRIBPO TaxID=2683258 RepID=UPI0014122539|nr:hypothetical protein [Emticicia sp. CRIBPO]NBA86177.1 hypothetical protein [Emticicia sp. CRIBPO]